MDLQSLAETAVAAARSAGRIISKYSNQEIEVEHKDGGHSYASQVVTEVDRKAQDAILEILNSASDEYDFALLTEESEDDLSRFEKEYFWCIDPLDGTLPFTRKEPGYSVSIALLAFCHSSAHEIRATNTWLGERFTNRDRERPNLQAESERQWRERG